jgi:hypothetical protein
MNDAEQAAKFGTTLKSIGALIAWVGSLAAVIVLVSNTKTHDTFLQYGLPAILLGTGIVFGLLMRAAGYALRLMAAAAGATAESGVSADMRASIAD